MLDLRKVYLQVWVDKTLWLFQTVVFCAKRYCLTKLGFGLNVALQIMKTIVSAMFSQGKSAEFGLDCKDPEELEDEACVLVLDVRWKKAPHVENLWGTCQCCGWLHTAVGIIKCRANALTFRMGMIKQVLLSSPKLIAESVERATHNNNLPKESGASTEKK